MRLIKLSSYWKGALGPDTSFEIPASSAPPTKDWGNINERVALFEDHCSMERKVIAFATILTYDPPKETKANGTFTVGKIKKLSSPFQVPKRTTKMPNEASCVARRIDNGWSLDRPPEITGGSLYSDSVSQSNEICSTCSNRRCPFWNRFEDGDRSRFWVRIVSPRGKVVLTCPSYSKGKGKRGNAMVNPPSHILEELGLQIHPLNGLSYSPPLHPHQDTLVSARKRYQSDPDKLEMFDSALASRGDAQVIQERWCVTCSKKRSCSILAYLQQEDGQAVHIEDWVYWASQQGFQPVCVSHSVRKKKKQFIH